MPTEKDWKTFRKMMPEWQERYMERLCKEYVKILESDQLASDRFWKINKLIKQDEHKVGVQAEMSRSEMLYNLIYLVREDAITLDELDCFSEELQEAVKIRI